MDYNQLAPETPNDEENNNNNCNNLASPNPCKVINENNNPKKKIFGLDYNNNFYLFSLTNISDKYLLIEFIPADGNLPFSYKIIYNLKLLNMIDYIFKDMKTIDECMEKIISLLLKNRISIYRDEQKDLFYIILKITIIDEDKYIPLKLNCSKDIQICTIRYIYREITGILDKFEQYKTEKDEVILEQSEKIKNLKEKNEKYLEIIKKIKNIYENKNKEILNQITYRMLNLEKDLIYQKLKFKCEIIPNHKIIIFPSDNAKKGFNIEFKIKNIGYGFLSTKYDKIIFERNNKLSSSEIDFENKDDINIIIDKLFKPNDIIEFNRKFIIKNPKEEQIYNFYININSSIHGIISSKPLLIQVLIIPKNINNDQLSKYLKDNYEIDLNGNNINIFDIKGREIKISSVDKNSHIINKVDKPSNIEGEKHYNRYIRNKNKIPKKCNKNGIIYLNKIKDEIKDYLVNIKEVKISENKIRKIIEKLNLEYFASFWLENKTIMDIIIKNDGNYEKIAKIVEDML